MTASDRPSGLGIGKPLSLPAADSYDPDSGDISLSLPRSGSDHAIAAAIAHERERDRDRAASSASSSSRRWDHQQAPSLPPIPQPMWSRSMPSPLPKATPVVSPSTSTSTPTPTKGLAAAPPTVSLNDDVPSRPYPVNDPRRPRSPSSSQSTSATPTPTPTPTFTLGPIPAPRRRVSGTVMRSRSLNVRIPSVDLDNPPSPLGPQHPTSATSARPGPAAALSGRLSRLGLGAGASSPSDALGPRPPPLIDDDTARRMSRWVKEVVVCNFDLERGPVIERRAVGRRWGPGEKENVAFSSFPDTSLFAEGSILFSFKIRHVAPDPKSLAFPEPPSPMPDRVMHDVEPLPPLHAPATPHTARRDKAAEYRLWDERGREWLYGYVWFQQRRDRGIARGYMQKSVVILTHLPFPALFSAVLERVAPAFFQYGYSALEVACHAMATWPDPVADSVLELPLMSELLTVKLPDTTENPQMAKSVAPNRPIPILASLPASSPLRAFASFLPSLWSLWECLVLAEPVLVIAPDPKTCSDIVWWLRDLLRPIPLAGDFRPYLHIHDHDFSLLVNSNKPQAGVVVGVTNPFFRNAASHWPNVISIPSPRVRRSGAGSGPVTPATPNVGGGGVGVTGGSGSGSGSGAVSPRPDQPEGFITRRHRSVQKDRVLLKRLEALVAEGKLDDPAGNEALRTHFQQLTEKMLVPLNRYFQTLVPTRSPAAGYSTPAPLPSLSALKPFSLPTFLAHLRSHGPNPLAFKTKGLSTKSRVESDFYAAFCMGGCFAGWLAARVESLGIAVQAASNGSASASAAPTLEDVARRLSPTPSDRQSDRQSDTRSSDDGGLADGMLRQQRASDDSPRGSDVPFEMYVGRRASEGAVKALLGMSIRDA